MMEWLHQSGRVADLSMLRLPLSFAAASCGVVALVSLGADWAADIASSDSLSPVTHAVVDNVSHSLLGVVSWLATAASAAYMTSGDDEPSSSSSSSSSPPPRSRMMKVGREAVLAGLFASLMDLDHFLAARSLRLKDATSPGGGTGRPFAHSLAFVVVATVLGGLFWRSRRSGAIFAVAGLSHQLRDARRRGMWLASTPEGSAISTRPLVDWQYLLLLCVALPWCAAMCIVALTPKEGRRTRPYNRGGPPGEGGDVRDHGG